MLRIAATFFTSSYLGKRVVFKVFRNSANVQKDESKYFKHEQAHEKINNVFCCGYPWKGKEMFAMM